MKNIFASIIFTFLALSAIGQQEEQFTQFMYYKIGYNPGYAGSNDGACFTLLSRNQWLGLEGAPQTQLLSFNMPLFNKRVGIGANILRQTIGITENYTADVAYAYRIRMGRGGTLGLGVQASVRRFRNDYNKVEATQPKETDGAIPVGIQSKYVPNFGAGIYFSNQQFYLGISAPRLLENNIDFADDDGIISREVQHFFIMSGLLVKLGDKVQMQPQMLLKYVTNSPFDADVNLNFIFSEKITTGLSYRLGGSKKNSIGEAVSLLFGVQISDGLLFGLSYDATLTELRNYNSGSIEGMVRYCIGGKSQGDVIISPRFF